MCMKKRILGLVFIVFICLHFNAQTDSVYYGNTSKDNTFKAKRERNTDWLKRFTIGGNTQLYFSTNFTFVDLSPTIGFSPFEKLNVGLGFIYFYSNTNYQILGRFQQSAYGGQAYARYFFTDNFFGQAQYDKLRQTNFLSYTNPREKVWVDYFLIGGGYSVDIGKNSKATTSIMLNVSPNKLSIYPNPIVQFGFIGGF